MDSYDVSLQTLALRKLRDLGGTIDVVRVSSAQARGRAKRYVYYGRAYYRLHLTSTNDLRRENISRASSERRSRRLAELDAEATGLPVVSSLRTWDMLCEALT